MGAGTKAGFVAVAAAAVALSGVFAAAHELRQMTLARSHQQPTPELWFEALTPTSATLVHAGRELYLQNCAHCHAADVRGDEGPDLHGLNVSDRYIANTVRHGIPHEMPSFAKKLKPDDLTALVAYLRSLPDAE